jgi:lambda family phage tail tape measure protein
MANDITYKIGAEESISPALTKIQASVARTSQAFSKLQGAIAGIAFGAAIQSALNYADAIMDISDATEIGVANVLGFATAVTQLGGNTEKATNAIAKFGLTLGDALNGSLTAQNSFRDLGISLDDIASLDSQGLFDLTIKRLSELDDVTKRNRLSSEIFGKTLRGVDLKGLADQYGRATEAGRKYADDIKKATELQDKLGMAFIKFKLEVLKAIAPLIDFVAALKPEQIEAFVKAVIAIGGAAASISIVTSAISGLGAILTTLGGLALTVWAVFKTGLLQISGGMKAFGLISLTVSNLFKNIFGLLSIGFTSVAGIIARVGTIFAALKGAMVLMAAPLAVIAIGFGKVLSVVALVAAAVYGLDRFVKAAFDVSPIDYFLEKLNQAYTGFKQFIGLESGKEKTTPDPREGQRGRGDPAEIANRKAYVEEQRRLNEAQAAEADKMKELQKGLDLKRQTIRQITQDFKDQLDSQVSQIKLQGDLIGKSETQREVMSAVAAITKEAADKTSELQQEMAKLQGVEKDQLTPTYMAQIAAIEILRKVKSVEVAEAIRGNAQLKAAQDEILFGIREQNQATDDLLKIQREMSQIGLGDQAKQQRDIAAAADERARAEIRSLEASRGVALAEDEVNKIFAISRASTLALTDATNRLADAKEKFAQKESLRLFDLKTEYDLQDKLKGLQDEMAKMTLPALEQKYYDIAAAARDSADAAIRAEEDRRSAIAGTRVVLDPAEIKAYYEAASAGSAKLSKQTKALYDQSRSFATGWKKAFNEYKDAATNSAAAATRVFQKFTSGLEDAIVNFAKTGKFEFKSFVADMTEELLRSQIKQTISGLGDILGLGSLFGGGGNTAPGASPSNPSYAYIVNGSDVGGIVGSMTGGGGLSSIFGGGGAGSRAPSTASGGGIGGMISSIGTSISSVFGGITDTVGSIFGGGSSGGSGGGIFSGISDAVGSIFSGGGGDSGGGFFSGVSDLFSGFFANGGNIPRGRFGIAGEAGPEFIGGPASVTPMTGGTTNVTYNITATDAASFQALVARDPAFIHAVAQQGARTIPGRR